MQDAAFEKQFVALDENLPANGTLHSYLTQSESAPLNYFLHSFGPASTPTMHLGWGFTAVMAAVLLIVSLLLAGALFRRRIDAPDGRIGPEHQGMAWITVGTGISTAILFGLVVYMLMTLNSVAQPQSAPALAIKVTGYDWWWKVEYDPDDPERRIVTANEIHIPVGRPVLLLLDSADVIHAFWAPLLAGKTQMIPGQRNRQWLQADAEGVYRGQCVQFCGLQHAHMGFEIVAQQPADFAAWQTAQRRAAIPPPEGLAKDGMALFGEQCSGCHSVRGTDAAGLHGPDLTHLNSRRLLAAGLLTNTPEHRRDWFTHPQTFKPGVRMPNFALKPNEADALAAYLSTLD